MPSLLSTGLDAPRLPDYRLPIAPAAAVGGVLKPGDRVDVMPSPSVESGERWPMNQHRCR